MATALKKKLKEILPKNVDIVIMYGATEAAARLTYLEPIHFRSKIESIGKPIPGVSVRILDQQGNVVPYGEEGELVASGANIMVGYWNDKISTAAVLSAQGYHTGDIGYQDKDGFLYAKRRKDGLLKVSGHRVNPIEIEDILVATEQIVEAVVVGVPDKLLGTKLIVAVVPKEKEFKPGKLLAYCAAELPVHKCPGEVIILRTLPKNANGKIDRKQCKETIISKIRN